MIPDQWQVLYGSGDGSAWFILRGVYGRLPPQELDGLPLLGETTEVLRSVLGFRMRAAKRSNEPTLEMATRVHATMASELGMEPQQLTDYTNDAATPNLSSNAWGKLAKAAHFTATKTY
jgi:hypothetical protein